MDPIITPALVQMLIKLGVDLWRMNKDDWSAKDNEEIQALISAVGADVDEARAGWRASREGQDG